MVNFSGHTVETELAGIGAARKTLLPVSCPVRSCCSLLISRRTNDRVDWVVAVWCGDGEEASSTWVDYGYVGRLRH